MFLLLCALSLAPFNPAVPDEVPPVFANMTFEAGLAAAADQDKILVLDAMTSWCGPCKQMDVTTWVDAELVAWMAENTIALQLDMDMHVDLKNRLKIAAFPTILAFDENGEFDRIVGYRDAAAMGDWLKLVRAGSTELERIRDQITAYPWTLSVDDLNRRIHFANELYYVAGYADALQLAVEVWEAAPAADFNRSALRGILRDLAAQNNASKQAIAALRDSSTPSATPSTLPADSSELKDWIDLSLALRDHVGLESWILGRNARGEFASIQKFGQLLYPAMLFEQHWRAAGLALVDPIARFESSGETLSHFDAMSGPAGMTLAIPIDKPAKAAEKDSAPEPNCASEQGASVPKSKSTPMMPMIGAGAKASSDSEATSSLIRSQFRWDASNAYAVLLAADRNDEAIVLGETLLRYEDTAKARIAMVCRALEAGRGQARKQVHVRWLDEAMTSPTEDL